MEENNNNSTSTSNGMNKGDNPNKTKSNKSKSRPRRGKRGNNNQNSSSAENKLGFSSSTASIEAIDPRAHPISLPNSKSIQHHRRMNTRYIGYFSVRPECFDDLCKLTFEAMRTRYQIISNRVKEFREMKRVCDFIVYFSSACQYFETLSITQQAGNPYKLKSLKFGQIEVPNFLLPMITSLGAYATNDGIIRVKAIENIVMRLAAHAVYNAHKLYPDIGIPVEITSSSKINKMIWEPSDFKEDIFPIYCRLCGFETNFEISGIVHEIDGTQLTPEYIQQLQGLDLIVEQFAMDLFRWMEYYNGNEPWESLFIREIRGNEIDNDGNVNEGVRTEEDDRLWNGDDVLSDSSIVSMLNSSVTRFNTEYTWWIKMLFKSSTFVPSKSGTSCQFITPSNMVKHVNNQINVGSHTFRISQAEAEMGYLLLPSIDAGYSPEFEIFSTNERFFHAIEFTKQFAKFPE